MVKQYAQRRHAYVLWGDPILSDPLDCSPPGSPVHRIFHARILEWVAISYSSRSSQPRDQTHLSYIFCIGKWISTKKDIPVTEKIKLFRTSHCPSVPLQNFTESLFVDFVFYIIKQLKY